MAAPLWPPHFQLLSSVGVSPSSRSFYLRTKGELEQELQAIWPKLTPILAGGARKYRGVKVAQLGEAFSANVFKTGSGEEALEWDDFQALAPA